MATVTKDDIWKIFSLIMSILVVPLAGWVWTMNVKVAELHNDLGDAERTIESLETKIRESEDNAKQIISIEKDIEYMKGALNRIENLISGS